MGHTVLGNADRAYRRRNQITEWNVEWLFGPGGMPLPNIGSMDGNTGRSEGATAEKAVPFPCAVLDPNRSFVELRVREPRQGLVAFRHLQKSLNRSSASSACAGCSDPGARGFRTEMPAHIHGICSMTTVVRCPRTGHACSEPTCQERHWCRKMFERGLSHTGLP
jgi:hypothetical protein